MFKFNKKFICIFALILCVFLIIRNFQSSLKGAWAEHFRGFFQANPYLKRNMSYDLRGGLNIDKSKPGKFGGIAGIEKSIPSPGIFYGETIIKN